MSANNRLARLREAQGISKESLAEKLELHQRTIYRWERYETGIPEKYWAQLSEIFGVSVAHLLGLDDERRAAA